MTEENIELEDYIRVVSKHKWLIISIMLVMLLASFIVTEFTTPVYETSLQLLVSQKQLVVGSDNSSAGEAYQAILISERLAKTFSQMLQNRSTAEKVIEKLGDPIVPKELTEKIKAEPIRDTQLILVTVRDEDPARAQLLANTLGSVFEEIVGDMEMNKNRHGSTQALVNISVVELAEEPLEPIKPRPLMNAVLALLAGSMFGTGIAFLLSHMDRTIKEADEIERLSGLVSLGQVPAIQKNCEELIVKSEPRSLASEAFRMLRTNLQYINFESTVKTIIITSAGAGEGKTLFCANLAAVMARARHKVLLVGCDLRRPRLHQIFGLGNDVGLANFLIGATNINQIIQQTDVENLDIIVSGPTPPNPVDLLESRRMRRFLEEVKQHYDFIILDSPPISSITDALVLVAQTDGAIMLARHGVTNRQAFLNAKATLDKVNSRIIGFVLNAAKGGHANGYYEYYQKGYMDEPSTVRNTKKRLARILVALILVSLTALVLSAVADASLAKAGLNIF